MRGWLESLLVAGAVAAAFCAGIGRVPFHADESQWIATSYFLEAFFDRQAAPNIWSDNYWTLTQPPLTRYTIALGRLAGGYGVGDLNRAWKFGIDAAANVANGAMPGPGLLWWSRLPMALLAALSIAILFRLVTNAAGRVAGYTVVLMLSGNRYIDVTLCRAMSEAPLLAYVTLVALAGDAALVSWRHVAAHQDLSFRTLRSVGASCFLMGSLCGLAAAAKLNGFTTVLAGLALCVVAGVTYPGKVRPAARFGLIAIGCALVLLGTGLVFVVVNPYLYADPLGRTVAMFNHRLEEMRSQEVLYPADVIRGAAHIDILFRRVLQECAALSFSGAWVGNSVLAAIGFGVLARNASAWLRGHDCEHTSVTILVVALATATPTIWSPLDWNRYYLLAVIFSTVCIAVGLAACARYLSELLRRRGRGSRRKTVESDRASNDNALV